MMDAEIKQWSGILSRHVVSVVVMVFRFVVFNDVLWVAFCCFPGVFLLAFFMFINSLCVYVRVNIFSHENTSFGSTDILVFSPSLMMTICLFVVVLHPGNI